MTEIDPQHAIWATVILTLAKTTLPWFAAQGEKIVNAWIATWTPASDSRVPKTE